jgi:hypothetical protein
MSKKIEFIYNLPIPLGSVATHEQLRDYVMKLGMSLSRWSFENHSGSDLNANIDGGGPNDVYTGDQVIDGGGI